jgi:Cys-rich repeat protein
MKNTWISLATIISTAGITFACSSSDTSPGGSATGGQSFGGTTSSGGSTSGGTGGSLATGGAGGSVSSGGTAGQSTGGAGGAAGADGDAGICKTPTTLHPPNADAGTQTLYCPFSGADGGKNDYCDTAGEHCCEPKNGTSACKPKGTPCGATDTDWGCEDPADCGSGMTCCGKGTLVQNTDPNCANYTTSFTGTYCAASCASGEITICTSNSQCPSGQTCLPFAAKGNQVGGCH